MTNIKETKEKIIESLENKKEYDVTYKFSDVIQTIKAISQGEAEQIANERLEKNDVIEEDTYCYEIEVKGGRTIK